VAGHIRFVGVLVWKQRSPSAITAATIGAQLGLVVGAVGIANHLIEAFVSARPFVLIISPLMLTVALLGWQVRRLGNEPNLWYWR
jgi:hypothetical protein